MATNGNTFGKSGIKGNKLRPFKTLRLNKGAIPKIWRSKRALLVVLLLASSAAALTSLGALRVVRPAPSLATVNASSSTGGAVKAYEPPPTPLPPLTKLKEYVYAGGRMITSEEKSCVPTLSPAGASLPQGGGTGVVNVSTSSGCGWVATSGAAWITITSGSSGVGAGTVGYSVAANSGAQRVGTITVNGQAFNITQAPNPASCSYALNKTSEPIGVQGGSGALALTTGGGCPWTASSNAPSWLSVTSSASGSGSATINYSVAANSGQQRIGAITVGGQTFTVTQAPNQASCAFALSPSSWLYPVGGGTGAFNVATGAGCLWDAATSYGWITITGGATSPAGGGSGTVYFTVQANNGGSRTGTISVRGQVFTISQCGYEIYPDYNSFGSWSGSSSITVSSLAGCSWSAFTNDWDWIHITSGASGSGNGNVYYSVDSYNQYNGYRSGTITAAGKTAYIEQFGPICSLGCEYPYRLEESTCECVCEYCENLVGGENPAPGTKPTGLTARYFGNATLSGQSALERTNPVVNFDWAANSPDQALPADGFSARWSGQLAAPSGEAYTFYLYSGGGARLWVNNQLVIDRWQNPSEPYTSSAPVELKADAKADIRVEYYNAGGNASIRLLWSGASTPKQIIPQKYLYPEAATNRPTSTDTNKQSGMLLPPGSDAGPNGARLKPGEWLRTPLGRAGLASLIACCLLALLLRTGWRQAHRRFAMAAAGVVSRLRDQIKAQSEWLFRIAAVAHDKLQFVIGFGNRLLVGTSDKLRFADFGRRLLAGAFEKLKFVGHFLAAFLFIFKVMSYCGAVMRLGSQKLARLLPERVRAIARQALQSWRSSGVARLKPVLRRALVIALVVRLATPLSPAEAEGLRRAAQATWLEARAYTSAAANRYGMGGDSDLLSRLIKMASSGKRPGKVVSAASQTQQVADLQICPRQLVMFVGERYTLTPVALDSSQKVVHGVGMSWSSLNSAVAKVSSFGQVEAVAVGNTAMEVQCGNVSKQIQVQVLTGRRQTGSNQQADLDPTNDCAAEQSLAFAPQSAAFAPAQQDLMAPQGVTLDWDPQSIPGSRAADFKNAVGNPRFGAHVGSSNYQFNVPVVNVGGRGVSADVDMSFNSRVWNADNGKLTFNYVGAYPAPGWTIGYGKIIRNYNATATGDGSGVGSPNSPGDYLLVSADGTRTRLAAKYDAAIGRWLHESDDGSFLQFDPRSGEMRHPDGTRIIYSSVNGCLLPTAMIGTNGGAITMTYRDYCEGANCVRVFRHRTALSAIRDTKGRYVTFHYYEDGDYPANAAAGRPPGELAAIKAPDMNGDQQEVIQVEYQPIILKYDFGGAIVDAPPNNSQVQVVRRIHYPQTGRGYLFLDYSSYGMARKISTRERIKGAGGAVTDGVEIAYTTYNYTTIDPNDPYGRNQVGSLSDFPQFTRKEEWWQGKTDASGAPTTVPTRYDYSRTTDASTETETIKYVDKNFEVATKTGTDSGQLSFGKVISVERKNSGTGVVLSSQVSTYVTGPDGEVEIGTVETTGETGQSTLVGFGYGKYGRVTDLYEYGYKQGGSYQVRRRTNYGYVEDQPYLDARFLRLVNRTSVYDAKNNNDNVDDELKSQFIKTYDDYAAMGGMQSYGLNPALYPPNHDSGYDQNKVVRGNATAVKTFSRITPEESTTRRAKYDIFGNVIEAELSCCVVKSHSFSGATAYSEPDSTRSGAATGLNLETTYQYNYFTGLVDNETNPDGLLTTYEYDKAFRLKKVTAPTGAVTETQFVQDANENDLSAYVSKVSYDDRGTPREITNKHWFDGAGQLIRAGTGTGEAPDSYDMTATVYDSWGRVVKQSNPYLGDANGNPQAGVTLFWTVNTYDESSRVTRTTLPDNQYVQTTYIGATATSGAGVITTDTVGRTRKRVVDWFGRLVKVIEQNPANGNLEWETSYSYDTLDNLTQINQGGQLRTFIYDAKSRLTSKTTPEGRTTSFSYTDFDAVKTRTDMRGVVTTYTYGPLNMLTGVSYNTASAPGVATTAAVTVTHRSASPGKGQIGMVADGAGTETYVYDNIGRLQSSVRAIDGMSYEKRYEYNEAGQITSMTYPSGKRVKVGRDVRGRLAAMQRVDASGIVQDTYLSGINYRADGQISSQNLGDGSTESFGYSNDRLQLTSQTVTKGGNTLLSLSYGYGAVAGQMGSGSTAGNNGQIVSINGTINGQGRNQAFTYDNLGRLNTATGWGAWARRYAYDPYGNRTGMWDAVSGGAQLQNTVIEQVAGVKTNRIASVNGTTFSYDASGNVTGDGTRTFTYDGEGRVVSVSMSGLGSESYGYDSGNRRVRKEAGGGVTHCVYEGNEVIAEYQYGGGAAAIGTRYYHQDHLSTKIITTTAGAVVGTMDQLPFGEQILGSGETEKHQFTNYERDPTNDDYALNRHYDPRQGRFNQVDPLGMGASSLADPQSLNLYSYVQSDPINRKDPTGLFAAAFDDAGFWGGHSWLESGGGGGGGGGWNGFCSAQYSFGECGGMEGIMSGNFGDRVAEFNREYGGLPEQVVEALMEHNERVGNAFDGKGYRTNAEIAADQQRREKEQEKEEQKKKQKSQLQGPPPVVTTGDPVVDAAVIVAAAAAAIFIAFATEIDTPRNPEYTTVEIKDEYVIVRGGANNNPPLNGTVFSGAFGVNIYDAGKGVPHNQLTHTTAGEIRKSGGTVVHVPEPAWPPDGPINIRHVNITLGASNPFVGPIPNPAPQKERIPSKPKK
jgi:RHS repeat-associated protein